MVRRSGSRGFDNPWVGLPFLAIYGFPWLFRAPARAEVVTAFLVLPLFLVLFIVGHRHGARHGLICAFGLALLGLAAAPVTLTAAVLFVFAAALIGRSPPGRRVSYGLSALTVGVAIFGLWLHAALWQWLPVVFLCAVVGYYSYVQTSLRGENDQLAVSRLEAERAAARAERDRMTRDLHDLLGRSLTQISVKAELAERLLGDEAPAAGRELREIRLGARSALQEMRQVVTDTRRLSLAEEIGLARSVLADLGIALDAPAVVPRLPLPVDQALAYITREAVTNIMRHAGACEARIQLVPEHGRIRLAIADTGARGEGREGNGVLGMRARAEALGGTFAMICGAGTQIEVVLPVNEAQS